MNRQLPWARIVAEGFVIVVSILLALAADAWWDQRSERRTLEVGLLTEERLRSVVMPLSDRLSMPWVQERWMTFHRAAFVPSFQSFVDSIIAAQ